MPKITPFLWFDTQAEEAANLLRPPLSQLEDRRGPRYGEAGPGPKGR